MSTYASLWFHAAARDRAAAKTLVAVTDRRIITARTNAFVDSAQVDALAAVLAESMTIPDVERDELRRRRYASIEAGEQGEGTRTRSTEPTGSEATTCGAE